MIKKPEKILSGPSGVTLVEILIALTIASLVMLPVILLFGITERVTYKSTNEVVASNLALQKIEELRSQPFSELRRIIELAAEDMIEGPFEEVILPVEVNGMWNSPGVEYARETRLSFYPNINPDSSRPDFEMQKRRIRLRVLVRFIERVPGAGDPDRERIFELSTITSDENLGSGLNASFPINLESI